MRAYILVRQRDGAKRHDFRVLYADGSEFLTRSLRVKGVLVGRTGDDFPTVAERLGVQSWLECDSRCLHLP